jgi:hypothetical protein
MHIAPSQPAVAGKVIATVDDGLLEFATPDTTETLARCEALRTRTPKTTSEHREVNPFPASAARSDACESGDDDEDYWRAGQAQGIDDYIDQIRGARSADWALGWTRSNDAKLIQQNDFTTQKAYWRRINDAALSTAGIDTTHTPCQAREAYLMPVRSDRITPRGGQPPLAKDENDRRMVATIAANECQLIAIGAGLSAAPRWLTADVLAVAYKHKVSADVLAGRAPKGRWPLPSKNTIRRDLAAAITRMKHGYRIARKAALRDFDYSGIGKTLGEGMEARALQTDKARPVFRQIYRPSFVSACLARWRDAAVVGIAQGLPWFGGIARLRSKWANDEYQRRRNEALAEVTAIRALDVAGATARRRTWLARLAGIDGRAYGSSGRSTLTGKTLGNAVARLSRQWEAAYRKACSWDNGRYREGTRAREDWRPKLPKVLPWRNFG